MLTATSGFKTNIKSVACYSNAKFDLINTSGTTSFDNDDIIRLEIFGSAIQNGKVLGNLAQHSLTIEVHGNITASINMALENRIETYIGVYVTSAYEYIKQQSFIVTEVSYSDTTNITKILATDYLVKLNKEFVDTNTYPMTLKAYLESVLTYCGLSLQNTTFTNSTFSVASRPFVDYTNCKEIVSRVAELALCYVVINKTNDKVELRPAFKALSGTHADLASYTHAQLASYTHAQLSTLQSATPETLNKDQYFDIKFNDYNFGTKGINTLVLKISQIDGENDSVENATNVAIDGAIEVVIEDNDFINTSALRQSVINTMFAELDGRLFLPYTLNYRGFPYYELGDVITVTKMDNSTVNLPIFETNIKYNGGLNGQLSAKTLNKSQTSNKFISKANQRVRATEIRVDKVESEIVLQADEITILTNSKEDIFYKQTTKPFDTVITNGGFDSVITGWYTYNTTASVASGILTSIATAQFGYVIQNYTFVSGRKYYMAINSKNDSANVYYVMSDGVNDFGVLYATNNGVYTWRSVIGTATATGGYILINVDNRASAWTTQYCSDVVVIDLTTTYGAGNEPTKEVMDTRIKQLWLDTSTNSTKSFSGSGWKPTGEISGAKYVFDGTNATFYNGGLIIKNNAGTTVMTADTNGDIQVTGEMMVGSTSVNAGLSGSGTASTSIRIWAGYATPSTSADFYVRDDGYMKANKGVIGGWTIASGTLTAANSKVKLDATNSRIYLNTSAYLYAGTSASGIYTSGNLYATSAVTVGTSITLNADTAGNIFIKFGGNTWYLYKDVNNFLKVATV